jgi:hypothetical protein
VDKLSDHRSYSRCIPRCLHLHGAPLLSPREGPGSGASPPPGQPWGASRHLGEMGRLHPCRYAPPIPSFDFLGLGGGEGLADRQSARGAGAGSRVEGGEELQSKCKSGAAAASSSTSSRC